MKEKTKSSKIVYQGKFMVEQVKNLLNTKRITDAKTIIAILAYLAMGETT